MHEFQTIEGVVEDVTTIVLNLKNIVVKNHSEDKKKVYIEMDYFSESIKRKSSIFFSKTRIIYMRNFLIN